MDGTYLRCPKLLMKVAMVQCYRPLDASVPSNALAGTFTIGFRNLNLYVCATCPSDLSLSNSASLETVVSLPKTSFLAHHTTTQPVLPYEHPGYPVGSKSDDFHIIFGAPSSLHWSFKDQFLLRSFVLLFSLPFHGPTRIPTSYSPGSTLHHYQVPSSNPR